MVIHTTVVMIDVERDKNVAVATVLVDDDDDAGFSPDFCSVDGCKRCLARVFIA